MRWGDYEARDYQMEACQGGYEQLLKVDSTLISLPMGTGKSLVIAALADAWTGMGGRYSDRVLICAHRDELIRQISEHVFNVTGDDPGLEQGPFHAQDEHFRPKIVISSVQTISRYNRLTDWKPDEFGLLCFDESQHAPAESWLRIRNHFASAKLIGLTGTAERNDEKSLGQVFESVAFHYDILDAINDGWLCRPYQEYAIIDGLEWYGERATGLEEHELSQIKVEEGPTQGVVDATIRKVGDRPTLVFAMSINHAHRLAEIHNRHQPGSAFAVTGGTSWNERHDQLEAFRNGDYQFLIGCDLFLEGLDVPRIAAIVIARPVKSRTRYAQIVGRGLRGGINCPVEGKTDCKVIDFVGSTSKLSICSVVDLLGGKYDSLVKKEAWERVMEGAGDALKELEKAEQIKDQLRAKERASLLATARFKTKSVDPFSVLDIDKPVLPGWADLDLPSAGQIAALKKAKVVCTDRKGRATLTRAEAEAILDDMSDRRDRGLCSYAMMKRLGPYGYRVKSMMQDEAMVLIADLRQNNWKPLDGRQAGRAKQQRARLKVEQARSRYKELKDAAEDPETWHDRVYELVPDQATAEDWLKAAEQATLEQGETKNANA